MALTEDAQVNFQNRTDVQGDYVDVPVAAATTIYHGALVALDAAGRAIPYAAPTVGLSIVGGGMFIGVAHAQKDNALGAAGALSVRVYTDCIIETTLTGVALTDVGANVYASDDNTFSKLATAGQLVGKVVSYLAANLCLTRITAPLGLRDSSLVARLSPIIETKALNMAVIINPNENQNGLIIHHAFAILTEVMVGDSEDQGIITLKDSAGTTLAITFTPTNAAADAIDDVIQAAANTVAATAATGSAMVVVPAGLGVNAVVTQVSVDAVPANSAGAMKIVVLCSPIA